MNKAAPVGVGWRAVVIATLAPLSLVPFFILAPESSWSDPVLLAALAAIAGIAYSLKIWLEPDQADASGGTTFDATAVIVLVALYVGGPVPALAIWLIPDFLHRCVFRRTALFTRGLAVNVISFVAATLCGGAILTQLDGAVGLLLSGVVLVELNFALSPLLYALLFERPADRRVLLREHAALTPITVAMVAGGAASALFVDQFGVPGLILLAAVVALPEVRWRQIADRFPAARPEHEPSLGDRFDAAEELLGIVLNQVESLVGSHAPAPVHRPPSRRPIAPHHYRMRGDRR